MKRTYKILIAFAITNVIVLSLIISSDYISKYKVNKLEGEETRETYLSIITTNKFIYNMIKNITGDMHDVTYMSKEENELKDFKYTEDSIKNISKKDLFVFSGINYEPWVSSFVEELKRDKVTAVNASRGIRAINYSKEVKNGDKAMKENPYYWMNPEEYKTALANIKSAIGEKDPQNLNFYNKNFNSEIDKVDKLINEFKRFSSSLEKYKFLIKDERLEYLFKFMGVKYTIITDNLKPDNLENSKENLNLAYIYIENEDKNTDDELLKQNNISSAKLKSYDSEKQYVDFMKDNLDKIRKITEKVITNN